MSELHLNQAILDFFAVIEKYYGCTTEITEGISTHPEDADRSTWNLSKFELLHSAYRNSGNRFMFEGETMYYEIAAEKIIDFKQPGRHTYEFIEQYGESVWRITKIRFHHKY